MQLLSQKPLRLTLNLEKHPIFHKKSTIPNYNRLNSKNKSIKCIPEPNDYVPEPIKKVSDPRKHWNPRSLAFLGDSVWELYIRRQNFANKKNISDIHHYCKEYVSAESQSSLYQKLISGEFLTDFEREVIRWGKNTKRKYFPKRFRKSNESNIEIYRNSTGLECLVGFLYLSDMCRLNSLMEYLGFINNQILE